MARDTLSRSLHDLGLSAWFGGTLANAVALNPAAGKAGDDSASGRVANTGWDRWTPVNAAAIGLHLAGSVGQLAANKGRIGSQPGSTYWSRWRSPGARPEGLGAEGRARRRG